jgi:hypothetical protein
MVRLLIISSFLFLSGCACTGCFTDDVKSAFISEKDTAIEMRGRAGDFFVDEFASVRGIERDLKVGSSFSQAHPSYYIENFSEIFCPCP